MIKTYKILIKAKDNNGIWKIFEKVKSFGEVLMILRKHEDFLKLQERVLIRTEYL